MAITIDGVKVAGMANNPKSAFEIAQANGYTGTEAEFNEALANVPSLSSEMEELKTSVSEGKSVVAAAVTDKGVNTAADASFDTIANNIDNISTLAAETSDATAAAADILTSKTAYIDGNKITGTMTNQGAKTSALNCGGSYTIPAGYHNGSGKITANSLASQTSGTATAATIASGYTAWVNGSQLTGTMAVSTKNWYTTTKTFSGSALTSSWTISEIGFVPTSCYVFMSPTSSTTQYASYALTSGQAVNSTSGYYYWTYSAAGDYFYSSQMTVSYGTSSTITLKGNGGFYQGVTYRVIFTK